MSNHEFEGREEYETAGEFLLGAGESDEVPTRPAVRSRYALHYVSSYSDTVQIVVGELRVHGSEYATLDADDGNEYTVMGYGLSDREPGEVYRRKPDGDRRKMGEFDMAHAVSEESE